MPRRHLPAGPTRADATMKLLRSDILNGRLKPGARLGFADLGARYAVSSGVLREILPRLVEQGLATSEAQLGFRVITVSVADLTALTEARVALETLLSRQAVALGDVAWEADVVATHHALARTPFANADDQVTGEWLAVHEAFHLSVLRGCGNPYLLDSAARLRSIAEVYRCWSRSEQERTHRDIVEEHREIMEAAVGRDAPMVSALTERHIRRTAELLISTQVARATNA